MNTNKTIHPILLSKNNRNNLTSILIITIPIKRDIFNVNICQSICSWLFYKKSKNSQSNGLSTS
jgi:hypothetical protein